MIHKLADFLRLISESNDKKTSLKNENKFFSVIASISMLIASVASFSTRYYILNENIKTVSAST
ncbi:hypothetical protein [Clostridium psychrophilum]|uniref:hypothetical protein n=1 Tax=Clostridium psychrophilum TaxID=132926 RepID=UPI001C0AF00D|nr:hypothetical protein [Clostridium psychrophilum]MBU3182950.1 hypothetical protein [Clostridium psychrophilum]